MLSLILFAVAASRMGDITPVQRNAFGLSPKRETILYKMGSKVMTEPIDVHIIWYGLAWTFAQKSILLDFMKGNPQTL